MKKRATIHTVSVLEGCEINLGYEFFLHFKAEIVEAALTVTDSTFFQNLSFENLDLKIKKEFNSFASEIFASCEFLVDPIEIFVEEMIVDLAIG